MEELKIYCRSLKENAEYLLNNLEGIDIEIIKKYLERSVFYLRNRSDEYKEIFLEILEIRYNDCSFEGMISQIKNELICLIDIYNNIIDLEKRNNEYIGNQIQKARRIEESIWFKSSELYRRLAENEI